MGTVCETLIAVRLFFGHVLDWVFQLQAKRALGKGGKNAKALAAMAALLQGLDDGEEVWSIK